MCKSPFCYTIVTGPVTCVCAETLTILMELNVMLNTLFAVVFFRGFSILSVINQTSSQ